jgi:hypothetical protein
MDLPIKISPKMVFICKTDSLGRDNLKDKIWVLQKKPTVKGLLYLQYYNVQEFKNFNYLVNTVQYWYRYGMVWYQVLVL